MVNVYCDMEGTNCNGEGGWTRVAFFNVSGSNATCPTGFILIMGNGVTLCFRGFTNRIQTAVFPTHEVSYSSVCGRIRGYQFGPTSAFANYINNNSSLDDVYVDGVSITHGANPRRHIWTYAIGRQDDLTSDTACPCNNGSTHSPPSYVGNNYYCESLNDTIGDAISDPLWDGMRCSNLETTCCTSTRLPWFSTTLPAMTNDDIELRLMLNTTVADSLVAIAGPLDLIELYIR